MLAGLVGGVIAAGAMSVVHKSLGGIGIGSPQQKPAPDSHQDEDATVKVADGIARGLLHHSVRRKYTESAANSPRGRAGRTTASRGSARRSRWPAADAKNCSSYARP
jgi:hypothetical protein